MKFKCTDAHIYCDEFLRGDISLNLLDAVSEHLESCSECRSYYEKQKKMTALFKNDVLQFKSIVPEVMHRIESKKSASGMWYVSMAAACIIAFFIYTQGFSPDMPVPAASTATAPQSIFEPGVLLHSPVTGAADDFGDI